MPSGFAGWARIVRADKGRRNSNTQAFRDSMDEAGIKGFYHTTDDGQETSEGKRTAQL